jgi:hypothetical protein
VAFENFATLFLVAKFQFEDCRLAGGRLIVSSGDVPSAATTAPGVVRAIEIHRESLWPRSTFLEAGAELPFFKKSGFGNMARRFSGVIALVLFAELNQVAGTWIYRVRHTIQIFTHRARTIRPRPEIVQWKCYR